MAGVVGFGEGGRAWQPESNPRPPRHVLQNYGDPKVLNHAQSLLEDHLRPDEVAPLLAAGVICLAADYASAFSMAAISCTSLTTRRRSLALGRRMKASISDKPSDVDKKSVT